MAGTAAKTPAITTTPDRPDFEAVAARRNVVEADGFDAAELNLGVSPKVWWGFLAGSMHVSFCRVV
ncbi:hypothetical protein RCH23_000206 [Cryobacterium sp. CAN_C3]|uniref:hypothetical protein n=1 Tax=unclassified Cryobacterium TaxID=2649013 RepID=UPI001A25BD81|nr:hypothetical protein [Cryobacterium sp. CAN_C3]